MYFLGTCYYVAAMVDDLAITLNSLDNALRDHSAEQQVLVKEARFHNEIIEYYYFDVLCVSYCNLRCLIQRP